MSEPADSASRPSPRRKPTPPGIVGWREWAGLPDLGISAIKAKVDTGARTSALHAFDIVRTEREDGPWVRFRLHPIQRDAHATVEAAARLVDERWVRSSSGRRSFRPVIETRISLGGIVWKAQITLVRRDLMGFRMLLGRRALEKRWLVDPGRSWVATGRRRRPAGTSRDPR